MKTIKDILAVEYDYFVTKKEGIEVLVILDGYSEKNPTQTVTNGIIDVLRQIKKIEIGLPRIIIYKDSEGIWDRINTTKEGIFSHFSPIKKGLAAPIIQFRSALDAITL